VTVTVPVTVTGTVTVTRTWLLGTWALFVLSAVVIVSAADGAPPRSGLVVPGRSLGGLRLGATQAQVRAHWGSQYGRCRGCPAPTWYFSYRRFEPQGAGVTFRDGRAIALFTLWSPPDWRTNRGVAIGDSPARVAGIYGTLLRTPCTNYYALTIPSKRATTAIYVFDDQVWGFALLARGQRICR
jgi:hypothetical protein